MSESCAGCSDEELGRAAAYARPAYAVVDPARSAMSLRDERSRGSSAMMLPPAQTSYAAGRI